MVRDPWEHEEEATAIDEVCARLGRPRSWIAEDGFEHTIVAGAVRPWDEAWVERRGRDDGGWEEVEFHLWMGSHGARERVWCVETYNPYFGCEVGLLQIGHDGVVMVYREKHRTVLAVVGDGVRMRAIGSRWRVDGERVLWQSEAARGLVEWAYVPELVMGLPVPLAWADRALAADGAELPWPRAAAIEDVAAVQAAIVRRLFGARAPEPLAGLLVGALAWKFWAPEVAVVERYDELPGSLGAHNDPHWLPWYWQQELAGAQAQAVLTVMEELAGREPAAPEAGAQGWRVELACRHVAERCVELAAACRAGRLPAGERCFFWVAWSQAGFAAGPRGRYPDGLWRVWEALRGHADRLKRRGE